MLKRFPLLEWHYGSKPFGQYFFLKSQAYNTDIPFLNHCWVMFLARMGRSENKTVFENQNMKSFQK